MERETQYPNLMAAAYINGFSLLSSLGITKEAHHQALINKESGIKSTSLPNLPFNFKAGLIDDKQLEYIDDQVNDNNLTQLEKLIVFAIKNALSEAKWQADDTDLQIIISTTKGNVDTLKETSVKDNPKALLSSINKNIGRYFNHSNEIITISNACISGVLALNFGVEYLQQNSASKVLVVGADMVTRFTVSGFHCLNALDPDVCKPYDKGRIGINLGDGIAAICLSQINNGGDLILHSGASSNDANHISGPSRTGEGLKIAIEKTLKKNNISSKNIDFINGHGTATIYNDEMESIAFQRTNLNIIPINSFKGYIGHTLGAAGVIEVAIAALSLTSDMLYPSYGFKTIGTSNSLNVIQEAIEKPLKYCLKTASGFGGCNAAIIIEKQA